MFPRNGRFSNNPAGSRISSIGWINEAHKSLLFLGSNDGVVRVWNGLLESGCGGPEGILSPKLVTAFHAAPVNANNNEVVLGVCLLFASYICPYGGKCPEIYLKIIA